VGGKKRAKQLLSNLQDRSFATTTTTTKKETSLNWTSIECTAYHIQQHVCWKKTHVEKNSSGSESRVIIGLSPSPSRRPIKGLVAREVAWLEIWLLTGANATDSDARKAIAVKSKTQMDRIDIMIY
jgi:hypothetical protein